MAITVMAWNIQKFSKSKSENVAYKTLILNAVANAKADVFAIIETQTSHGGEGRLIGGSGATGAVTFWEELQNSLPQGSPYNWHLVPPVETGSAGASTEGIAVYYKSTLTFQGPGFIHAGNLCNMAPGAPINAPAPYNAAGIIPAGLESRTGQWDFYQAGGARIDFPTPNQRRPFHVVFSDGTTTYQLYFMHAPSPGSDSAPGTAAIATITEIAGALPANTVQVIAGDFNVELTSVTNFSNGFRAIRNRGFMTTNPYNGIPAAPLPVPGPGTQSANDTTYKNLRGKQGAPGATINPSNYLASAYDTTLSRPAGTGFHYDLVQTSLGGALGSILTSLMANYSTFFPSGAAGRRGPRRNPVSVASLNTLFIQPANFGNIRKTSDHIPQGIYL